MRDDNATVSQKQLNISQADAEHIMQPDGKVNDLGGETTSVAWVERRLRATSLVGLPSDCQTGLPWRPLPN